MKPSWFKAWWVLCFVLWLAFTFVMIFSNEIIGSVAQLLLIVGGYRALGESSPWETK